MTLATSPSGRYHRCPDCGRWSVYLQLKPRGEDNYRCRYFDCADSGDAEDDRQEARLLEFNEKEGGYRRHHP
jgi:hypothetical protein